MSDDVTIPTPPHTLDDVYYALLRHTEREGEMLKKVEQLFTVVLIGTNGTPSLSDTVREHSKWIAGVNRLVWIFVAAVVGQMVVGGCSIFLALFVILQEYMTKVP